MANLPDDPVDANTAVKIKVTDEELERIALRFSTADSDEKFEETLKPIIVPLLGQLSDATESFRKKILELLTHINRRLRSRPQVQLPVEALLCQYNDRNESFFVANFSHIYIKMGYPRLSKSLQLKLIPSIFMSLSEDKPVVQKDMLLHLTLPILCDVVLNESNKKAYEAIPRNLYKYALHFYTLVLLMPYSFQRVKKMGEEHAFVAVGMSVYDYTRVMPTNPNQETCISNPDDLQKVKVNIVKFLGLHIFPPEDLIVPVIVACGDTRHPVVSLADKEVKPLTALVDWESKDVLNEILDIYLARERENDPKGRVEAIRLPPSVSLRMKLIPYLMKSRITFPNEMTSELIECAFDAMEDTTQLSKKKLVSLGLDLILSASRSSSILSESLSNIIVRLDGYLYSKTPPEDGYLKVKAFHVFGEILCKDEMLLLKDIEIIRKLFNALPEDFPADVKLAIQECLNRLISVYKSAKFKHYDMLQEQLTEMEKVLYENIEKEDPVCRQVAVHYASEIYPPDHISTRYLILQALGDKEERVRSEAKQAFHQFQADSILMDIIEGKVKLPDFVDFVNHDTKHSRQNPFVQVDRLIPVVEFIRLCLLASTVGLSEAQINMPYEEEEFRFRICRNIRAFMSGGNDSGIPESAKKGVDTYFRLIQVVIFTKTSHTPVDFPKYLEEALVGNTKDLITNGGKQLFDRMNNMLLLTQRGASSRHACASVYSLVTLETESPESVLAIAGEMIDKIPKPPPSPHAIGDQHAVQGNALGAAYLIERLTVKQKGVHGKGKVNLIATIDKFLHKLDGYLFPASHLSPSNNNPSSTMACNELSLTIATLLSALQCYGQCGALAHLPVGKPGNEEPWMSKAGIIKRLVSYIRPSQSPLRVKEAALKCLSAMCTAENNFPHGVNILQTLMETHVIKDVDFHMSVGQCIVNILLGSSSPYKGQWFERQYPPLPQPKKCGQREMNCVLTRVQELLAHSSPLARQAAGAWVLVILRKLGIHADMHLSNLQTQLMCLLSDRDDTTQDIACQAITLLFDLCPASDKESLVSEMVSVLSNGKKRRTDKFNDDSDNIASGEVKTEDGNMVTYKELCSLATSLNQPDLIYSFLSLASVQSEWATRRGVAMGLIAIARKMGALLKPFLPKLVPKLYRYQFDPNVKVQMAMIQIGNVISKESSSSDLIEEFFREIFNELNLELHSPQPRIREACCLAMRDLLHHRCAYSLIRGEMGGLFKTIFALMDDTKWPVRKAAETTAQAMRKYCLNICEEPSHRESLPALLTSVVPVLVEKGLTSNVGQIRSLTMESLLAMVRHGRESLRPVITELVVASLQALTTLEPTAYNEFSQLLAGRVGEEAREKLDQSRAAASMMSNMAEILRLCVRYIDENTLDKLVVPLTEVIRNGLGLGTRFGCGNFLTQLAAHCGGLLAPHTGKLLAALLHGVLDKNKVVQKSMASAIGSLVGFAKSTSVEKLLLRVKAWYFEKEDAVEYHRACCYVFQAIANSSSETIQKQHMIIAAPMIFVAKQTQPKLKNKELQQPINEEKEELLKIWQEIWIELVPSESRTLERYHQEILTLIVECFNSQSWSFRLQATLSLNSLMESCTSKSLDVWRPLLLLVSEQLVQSGRMWQGKHHLLKSVMIVVTKLESNELISATEEHHDTLLKNMFKEVKRDDHFYQCFAYSDLGFICDVFKKDYFAAVYNDIKELFNKMVGDNSTSGTSELLASIGYFWPKNQETQKEYLKDVVTLLLGVIESGLWMHQSAALISITQIFSKLHPDLAPNSDDLKEFLPKILDNLKILAENCKQDSLRLEIIHFISVAIKYKSVNVFHENWDKISKILDVFTKDKSLSSNVLNFAITISKHLSNE